jgi:aryl-alcohol dehydrogenase-like predicted oxidoreductase
VRHRYAPAVEQRRIGTLQASVVGLGCNQFGTKACDEKTSGQVIGEALDAGITYFDTADEYGAAYFDPSDLSGWGRSEEILGAALKSRRDEVVIASKFGAHPHGDTERGGASARWARRAVEDSLQRLGTDRIDLYQVHFPDPSVPVGETLTALDELVAAGKVGEVGCCNFPAAQLEEAAEVATAAGHRPFVSLQSALNLFQRGAVDDVLPTCEQLGIAFIPYYPLASGMLTGKYRRGEPLPGDTRLSEQVTEDARARLFSDRTFSRLEALEAFAQARGHTLLELAFAWLLAQPTVATVIAGAAKPGQAAANGGAVGWQLTSDEAAAATRAVVDAA